VDRVFVLAQPRGFSPPALFLPSDFGWLPIVSIILPGFPVDFSGDPVWRNMPRLFF
jgi:hypothetical protein